jgi:PTS system fructose-specific IIC component
MAGSAVAGALSLGLGASMIVPHGGVFLLFVPGAVEKPLVWLLAILVGTLVSTAALLLAVRAPAVEGSAAPALPATA